MVPGAVWVSWLDSLLVANEAGLDWVVKPRGPHLTLTEALAGDCVLQRRWEERWRRNGPGEADFCPAAASQRRLCLGQDLKGWSSLFLAGVDGHPTPPRLWG